MTDQQVPVFAINDEAVVHEQQQPQAREHLNGGVEEQAAELDALVAPLQTRHLVSQFNQLSLRDHVYSTIDAIPY